MKLMGGSSSSMVIVLVFLFLGVFQIGSAKDVDALPRKLLLSPGSEDVNRTCSMNDVSIFQGSAGLTPSGIPSFSVQIINTCASNCSISDIHVKCGWFSSVGLINPHVFRRVQYDDCLVNDGEPLAPNELLSFKYATSFSYPLSVSSLALACN